MRIATLFDEPKATERQDDENVICPYCGYTSERCCEHVDEDTRIETCDVCGKKYRRHEYITVTTSCEPDCALNGEEHQYALHDYGKGAKYAICDGCGKHGPRELIPESGR